MAVLKRNNSVASEKLYVDWLKDRVIVRKLESGVVAVRIQATFEDQRESISIVNAVAESFCEREPQRLAKEAQQLKVTMEKELAKRQSQENAEAARVMNQMFESEHFRETPRIVAKATVLEPL